MFSLWNLSNDMIDVIYIDDVSIQWLIQIDTIFQYVTFFIIKLQFRRFSFAKFLEVRLIQQTLSLNKKYYKRESLNISWVTWFSDGVHRWMFPICLAMNGHYPETFHLNCIRRHGEYIAYSYSVYINDIFCSRKLNEGKKIPMMCLIKDVDWFKNSERDVTHSENPAIFTIVYRNFLRGKFSVLRFSISPATVLYAIRLRANSLRMLLANALYGITVLSTRHRDADHRDGII